MKTLFTIIIILVNYSALNAQSGWFQQQTGTDITLRSVYMVDNNTGYCVGGDILLDGNAVVDRGIILKTTNGGANWVILSPPNFDKMLFAVTFSNALTGYAVGGGNSGYAILKTTNGGLNWIQQTPPPSAVTPPLHSLYFFDSESGYTAGTGGKIFRTTNGGMNWTLQNFPNVSSLHSITFTTASTGYIGADNALYSTINSGTTWDTILVLFGTSFKSVFFSDQNTGYAAGGNKIFKTTTGGNNWTSIEIAGNFFSSIYFPSQNTGYCAGENFAIYRTTDAGISWARQTQPGSNPLHSVFFSNDSMGIATGNVGFMLRTTTGGTVGITVISGEIPSSLKLHQNYPNPFNPETVIRFDVSNLSIVKLSINDATGRRIQTPVNNSLSPGQYEYTFNGASLSSGIYYFVLEAEGFTETKKMVLLK